MKKILCVLLAIVFIASVLVGCSKDPNSFDYEKYLKEQDKLQEQKPVVWIYDTEEQIANQIFGHYNWRMGDAGTPEKQYEIQLFSSLEYDRDAYLTKLQAAIMSGKGPDIVLTCDPNLLTDVNKVIEAGAMQAWDPHLTDFPMEEYYQQVIDGCRSEDGKLYLMPLTFNPYFVVTTQSNLEKYGMNAEDFSDANQTAATLLQLGNQTQAEYQGQYTRHRLPMMMIFPELLHSRNEISFSDPNLSSFLDRCGQLYAAGEFFPIRKGYYYISIVTLLNQKIAADVMDINLLLCNIEHLLYDLDTEQEKEQLMEALRKELVLFPLCDTEGNMCIEVSMYAMIPRNAKSPELASNLILAMRGSHQMHLDDQLSIYRQETDYTLTTTHRASYSVIVKQLEEVLQHPMNGVVMNQALTDYAGKINDAIILGDGYDWEELERSINIYLSE